MKETNIRGEFPMKQNESFLLREIENVPYLLPYGQMIADRMRGIRINDTGIYLWKLLEQERTLSEVLSLCADYYEIPEEEMTEFQADITRFIQQLISYGIIEDSAPSQVPDNFEDLDFTIGELHLKLSGPREAFPREFEAFVTTEAGPVHQHIELRIALPHGNRNGQILLRNHDLMVIEQKDAYILLFPQAKQLLEIHLKKDGSHALCYCLPPYTDTFRYDLFHAIRLLYLYLAQKHHMVALHSASILYQEKLWLFSGHSGAGKSTHTNLWKEIYQTPVINGDLNLLALEKGKPVVHGTPWCGTSEIYDTKTYPLGGIILLKQNASDFVEELSPDEKQLLVCQRLISPTWTPEQFDTNLDLVKSITNQIVVCRLHCTKENSAAETMKAYLDNISC